MVLPLNYHLRSSTKLSHGAYQNAFFVDTVDRVYMGEHGETYIRRNNYPKDLMFDTGPALCLIGFSKVSSVSQHELIIQAQNLFH